MLQYKPGSPEIIRIIIFKAARIHWSARFCMEISLTCNNAIKKYTEIKLHTKFTQSCSFKKNVKKQNIQAYFQIIYKQQVQISGKKSQIPA